RLLDGEGTPFERELLGYGAAAPVPDALVRRMEQGLGLGTSATGIPAAIPAAKSLAAATSGKLWVGGGLRWGAGASTFALRNTGNAPNVTGNAPNSNLATPAIDRANSPGPSDVAETKAAPAELTQPEPTLPAGDEAAPSRQIKLTTTGARKTGA